MWWTTSHVLEKHEDEFYDVVDDKRNLLWLKCKEVITEDHIPKIEYSNHANSKEILFEHLMHNADVAGLRMYCKMAIDADGISNMQNLNEERC